MDRLIIGCGYLGLRVASLWLARGDRVLATTRDRAELLRARGIQPVICDVLDPESLRELPEADTVLWCVGLDRRAGVSMREVYVDGLASTLRELGRPGRRPPSRLLYVGSTGVYGQRQGEAVSEASPAEPGEESGRVVLEAEQVLRRSWPGAVLLRFAGIYGPGRLLRAAPLLRGEPIPGSAEAWLNLIHVEDGAAAVVAAADAAPAGEVYNVSDGHPVARGEFFGELARLLGAPPPRFVPDGAPGDLGRRVSSRKLREGLGLAPCYPSFREGLAAAVEEERASAEG